MTTSVKEASSLEITKSMLISELTVYSKQDCGKLRGTTIVTCFKNVVCLELRSNITSLPSSLRSLYDIAEASTGGLFKLDAVVKSISEVRHG